MIVKNCLKVLLFVLLFLGVSTVSVSAAFWEMEEHPMIHDPSMIKEGDTWWTFGTGEEDGNGIRVIYSQDGLNWNEAPVVFPEPLSWWSEYVPNHTSAQWAPDIQYYNGRYWLYYSVSSFGSNQSLIGLLSTDSISSGNWRDDGLVVHSTTSDNFNAIDGDLVIDEYGNPWLSFGSYWSGIKLTRLDANTMKPTGQLHSIAARPNHPEGAVEAPNITYKDGYYYLFVSFDKCCSGLDSTYKVAVGRSTQITGPYLDKLGQDMLNGGGTIFDSGNDKWVGPGHQDVYNNNVFLRHAYDADSNGLPRLLINDLYWDSQGWPVY
ncbi:arabinan endo-1,5-alpha-L-arabinosidase [Gracilibacillus orientalis]|uniref:Endo-alpha-(1->5)-L-arabinanase n=1 Tax=Gracilibacillus orientalis TaxID=334253 RepID=A0A1I4IUE3_9BACI|nr:arabinan endo-1,5-alpha-L-arabinosidase [Gracilibacillus orientalis]